MLSTDNEYSSYISKSENHKSISQCIVSTKSVLNRMLINFLKLIFRFYRKNKCAINIYFLRVKIYGLLCIAAALQKLVKILPLFKKNKTVDFFKFTV